MTDNKIEEATEKKSLNFIEQIVEADLEAGKNGGRLQTRFPPEPNGYLHIGHAKAICMDFGVAEKFGGICNLRLDDTNPQKEDTEYVDAIKEDIEWLGFHWAYLYHASDYFQQLWDFAVRLIKEGKAYVDEQTSEQIAAQKGTPTQPGTPSPFRDRPAEESLALFEKMNSGELPEGSMICTLEFVPHRPLYDYFIDELKEGRDLDDNRPRQYEFNRLNLTYTVMSKRKLLALVTEHLVDGWDDPRMPTLCGLRRRGYSPEAVRKFIDMIGYTKFDALNDYAMLEAAAREDLNARALRVSAVLNPVKLIVTNYPEGKTEEMEAVNNPERPEDGTHTITFSRELWIERDDFMEEAPKKFFRMVPGKEVRLKNAYIVKCTGCKKAADGTVEEIYCEYDPESRSGMAGADRKVKGTLHWVSVSHCLDAEVRLYDRLFTVENPAADERDFRELLNPDSLTVLKNCHVESYLAEAAGQKYLQFQRIGYFTFDKSSTPDHLVFNRTVGLKDSWAKK